MATKFTYKKRSEGKWGPRPRGPPNAKNMGQDVQYSGRAQTDRDKESAASKSVWNSKKLASGSGSQVEKKPGSGYASKI